MHKEQTHFFSSSTYTGSSVQTDYAVFFGAGSDREFVIIFHMLTA